MRRQTGVVLAVMLAAIGSAKASEVETLIRETREATQPLLGKVMTTLKDTLATKPPHETVDVCRERLPGMVKEVRERTGWNIRRVSLKVRNAERGTPDAFEKLALADFDRRAAAGEKRELLEVGEIVQTPEGRVFRYLRALPVQETCMNCHGDAASLSPDLKAKLAQHYPGDQATGYSLGQIRGALTVQRKLP